MGCAGVSSGSALEFGAKVGNKAGLLRGSLSGAIKPAHGVVELDEAVVVAAEEALSVRDALLQLLEDTAHIRRSGLELSDLPATLAVEAGRWRR